MPTLTTTLEYDAHVDSKKRIVLRDASTSTYRVTKKKNGDFVLKPLEPQEGPTISKRTLDGMDKAITQMRAGKRGRAVDLAKLAAMKI